MIQYRSPFDERLANDGPPAIFTIDFKDRLAWMKRVHGSCGLVWNTIQSGVYATACIETEKRVGFNMSWLHHPTCVGRIPVLILSVFPTWRVHWLHWQHSVHSQSLRNKNPRPVHSASDEGCSSVTSWISFSAGPTCGGVKNTSACSGAIHPMSAAV